MNFVSNKRFSLIPYLGNAADRPFPQLYIGDKPFVKAPGPYHFQRHVDGYRGVPLIVANPNPNGYINPVLEWDSNNPIDGLHGARRTSAPTTICSGRYTGSWTPARRV